MESVTEETLPEFASPIEIPRAATSEFVTSQVKAPADILEIGCGEGHLLLPLAERGYTVVGVEADLEIVARAQANGIPVVLATWPDYSPTPADAIIFTRSLHHIEQLEPAVEAAAAALKPGGSLLVEEFAFDAPDQRTIEWFVEICRSEAGLVLVDYGKDEVMKGLLSSRDPVEAWKASHDHDLHTIKAMTETVARHFETGDVFEVPYLYRYLASVLPDEEEAVDFLLHVRDEEARLGETGEITLVGRHIVAS
ncbi:MAG: class I SAM-dependent methyltransferase [Gammaproteobacteria bacterium]